MKIILKGLGVLLCAAGILFVLGTVGADDSAVLSGTEIFTFSELIVRCIIGIFTSIAGIIIYKVANYA